MVIFTKTISIYLSIIMLIFGALSPEKEKSAAKEQIFSEMLNANYATEADFRNEYDLFVSSLIALRDKADENGYINRSEIDSFIYNMYGVDSTDLAVQHFGETEEKCFILIPPMGYDELSYEILEISETEEGYAAEIMISVNPHDSDAYTLPATAHFVENENSSFGFNLVNIDE